MDNQTGISRETQTHMNGYTFRGSNYVFIFASVLNGGQFLLGRICSYRSKFFPVRVDPILEGPCCPGKHTGSHKSCRLLISGKHTVKLKKNWGSSV